MKTNFKFLATLIVVLSFVSVDAYAINVVSDEKLIEIEKRLDGMSSIQLRNQKLALELSLIHI